MATAGFSVTEEQKQRIDQMADQWIKENGGNKNDFLLAMLAALENAQAKKALAGRADDLENVERLLEGLRVAYMSSLSMAAIAKDEVKTAAEKERERSKSIQETLQAKIDELKPQAERVNSLLEELADVAKRAETAEKALSDVQQLNKILNEKIEELTSDLGSVGEWKKNAERVKELEQKIKEMERERATAIREAVLAEHEEAARKMDELRAQYAAVFGQKIEPKETKTKTTKAPKTTAKITTKKAKK